MAYSRNEYLKTLNRMRSNYQNNGNAMVDTTDDTTNVGEEISSFAYMNTSIPKPQQEEKINIESENGYKRTVDTLLGTSAGTNVFHGVMNVVDDVTDFLTVVGGWIGGAFAGIASAISGDGFEKGWNDVQQGVQNITQYDWQAHVEAFVNQANLVGNLLNGNMFSNQYWEDWGNVFTDTEKARESVTRAEKSSWAQEADWVGQVEQGIGYVLPSLVVAYFTGGASLGAQVGIQAGIAGASAMGGGFEKASSEGAEYGEAVGYGLTKGAISGAIAGVGTYLGGLTRMSGVSAINTIGKTAGSKVLENGGSKVLAKGVDFAVTTAIRGAGTAGKTAIQTAIEPALQSIYDDNAWYNAYGTEENRKNYADTIAQSALVALGTSVAISGGNELLQVISSKGENIKNYDKQVETYFDALEEKKNLYNKLSIREKREYRKGIEEYTKLQKDNEKLTAEIAKMKQRGVDDQTIAKYAEENGRPLVEANKRWTDTYSRKFVRFTAKYRQNTFGEQQDGKEINPRQTRVYNKILNYSKGLQDIFKDKNTPVYLLTDKSVGAELKDGTVLTVDDNGKVYIEKGNQYLNVTNINGNDLINVQKSTDINNAMLFVNNNSNYKLPNSITLETKTLKIPDVSIAENNITITKDISSKILNKSNSKEIQQFLDSGIVGKGNDNFVMQLKDKDQYMAVIPYKDEAGIQKYGIVTVNSKTNELVDLNIKTEKPSIQKALIVPKKDEQKLLTTKLENEDGTAILYDLSGVNYDEDIGMEYSLNVSPADRASNGGFIYSKNPIKVSDFKKEIPFERLTKLFNIPKSLSKTYDLKINSKSNELAVLNWVADYTKTDVATVMDKLGYDAIVKNNGSVTVFNYGNFLDRSVKYGYGKRSDNYSAIIKRNVSNDTIQKLQEYISENGRGLETKEDQIQYSKLVRENFAYYEHDIEYDGEIVKGVKFINEEAYAPLMKSIVEYNNVVGLKTRFALRLFDDYVEELGVAGFYDPKNKQITIFTDTVGFGGDTSNLLWQVNLHELFHGLSDKLHAKVLLEEYFKLPEYPDSKEWNSKIEEYSKIWTKIPDYEAGSIEEELLANIFAGSQKMNNSEWVENFRKQTLEIYHGGTKSANNKYYSLLAEQEYEDLYGDYGYAENRIKPNMIDKSATENVKLEGNENDNGTIKGENPQGSKGQSGSERNRSIARRKSYGIRKILNYAKSNSGNTIGLGIIKGSDKFPTYVENVGGDTFHHYFSQIHKSFSLGKQCIVDLKDLSDYKKGNSLIRYDGKAVAFVTKDGDIVSIANGDTTIKGFTHDALPWAIKNGGVKMDCMNSTNGGSNLPLTYSKHGFDVVSKCKYDRSIMLESHSKEMVDAFEKEFGESDLVFLAYTGKDKQLYATYEDCQKAIEKLPYDDWETAYNKQTKAVEELKAKYEHIKIISDLQAKSSTVLIEAGADVSKDVKYRLNNVKVALNNALNEIVPPNGDYSLEFAEVKQAHAELNLAKPKDRAVALDNIIKGLKDTKVILVDTLGGEKTTLGDIITTKQEKELRQILTETLKGIAEPTKYAKWAKSLGLEKIKTHETARSFKLMNRIERKINSGTISYLSSPSDPVGELTLYSKIIEDVKLPFTNASLEKLTSNIALYYTQDNFGKMLAKFDIPFNSDVQTYNQILADSIQKGKVITAKQIVIANNLMQMVYNDLKDLGKGVVSSNRDLARDGVVLAQALVKDPKDNILVKGLNILKTIDQSIRSPISVGTTLLGEDAPLVVHLRDGGKSCENAQASKSKEFRSVVFENTGIKNLDAEGAKKVEFLGRKIKVAQAIKILNTEETANAEFLDKPIEERPFYKRSGSWTVGGVRQDVKITPADIENLRKQVSAEMLKWNEDHVQKFFDVDSKDYVSKKFEQMNSIKLEMVNGKYYPTHAVGDKIGDISVNHSGSVSLKDWGLSFLQQRVSHTDAPYNLDGDVFTDVNGYIQRITQWGEWAEWYKTLKVLENTRVFGQGTSLNAIMEKSVIGWKDMMDFVHHTALGIAYDNSQKLMGKIDNAVGGLFQNIQQVAMMDLFTQFKTLGSDFTGWQFFGIKNVIKGLTNYWAHGAVFGEKHAYEVITKYSPTLAQRFKSSEAFSANLGKVAKSKFSYGVTSVVRTADMHIHLKAFYMARSQVLEQAGKTLSEAEIDERTVRILEKYSDTTQPTTSKFNVGMYRSGANGKIVKQLFGMFQSMGQNIYQGLVNITTGWKAGVERIKSYEKASAQHQEDADKYRALEKEAEIRMNEAIEDEDFIKAEKEYQDAKAHREGHERSKATIDDQINKEKARFTAKGWFNKSSAYLAGLIGSGLILTVIAKLKKKTYGQEEWDDWDIKQMTEDTMYQSFVNWIPYIGTIANAIKNDSDLTIFTVDNMNEIISSFTKLFEAIKSGDGGHITGATLSSLMTLARFFGIPAESMWKLLNGVWYNVDHGSNIAFKNWLGMYSANYLKSNYKDAYEKGEYKKAYANLEVWTNNYSIKTSEDVLNEIYRLNASGYTGVAPSAIQLSYTDEAGVKHAYSSSDISTYKNAYAKADADVKSLVNSSAYKSLDDEYKAKAIQRVYSYYAEYARAKRDGIAVTSKVGKLLEATNGDIELAKYIAGLQSLSVITEDKKHSRKENVIKAINGMKNFNKAEKLLLAYLSGYSVSDSNKSFMENYLVKLGFSRKSAKEYLS